MLGGDGPGVAGGRAQDRPADRPRRPLWRLIAGEHGWFKIPNVVFVLFAWWAVFQIDGPPPYWTIYLPAYVGLVFLALTLIPGNLVRIKLGPLDLRKRAMKLLAWRRTFGIMAALWFFLHFSAAVRHMREKYPVDILREVYQSATHPGQAALFIFGVLYLTSWGWSRRLMGDNWKRLQSLVWYAVPLILVHSIAAKRVFEGGITHFSLIILLAILGFAVIEFVRLWKARSPDRWRHVAMIACGFALAFATLAYQAPAP